MERVTHPLRIGIIGAGSMGRTHARAWAGTPARVVGVCARTSASAFAREFETQAFDSLAAMLPHVDAVDICTPTDLHCEQALAAFASGKHVVCEKPMARSLAEAQRMLDAARSSGCQLLAAHVLRWFEPYAHAHEAVQRGEIGALLELHLMRRGPHPSAAQAWFADAARSGGVMLDLLIHDIDYARWVAGDVAEVDATFVNGAAGIMLGHIGGARSIIRGDWNAPAFETAARIVGARGSIEFDSHTTKLTSDPYVLQAQEMYRALADESQLRVTAHDAFEALRIALAAIECARV